MVVPHRRNPCKSESTLPDAIPTHDLAIRRWLTAVAAIVFALVVVGGATRLTESGLSITEWKPVIGTLPPLTQDAWQGEFEKYQTIPQYSQRNLGMTLSEFKTIYWWEWTHRLLARGVGVAYLLPFLFFLWRGWIPAEQKLRLWGIFALGGLQGAVGWWMVASGLVERTEVSQYRLATHLLLACLIFSAMVWTAARMKYERQPTIDAPSRIRITSTMLVVLVLVQIYLGALVAGLRAGLVYNTWPLIDGAFIPDAARLFFNDPLWRNFFENTLTAQFDHRMMAYAVWLISLWHAFDVKVTLGRGVPVRNSLLLALAITLQAVIGIATLLSQVAIDLALLHQAMAMAVLALAIVAAARLRPAGETAARLTQPSMLARDPR
jgi:cytochrome c oxidase assembly protein subunit 15